MSVGVMPFLMAITLFLMANIASPSASLWRKLFGYGEYHTDPWRGARALFAAGLRPGDVALNTFSYDAGRLHL
jgi:hypothetical protein